MIELKDTTESPIKDFLNIEVGEVFRWHNGRTYIKISESNAALMLEDDDLEDMKEVIPLH